MSYPPGRLAPVGLGVVILLIHTAPLLAQADATKPVNKARLRIGLSGTLFQEVPGDQAKQALENLKALIEKQTGRKSELIVEEKLDELAQKLDKQELDLAGLLGYELAWIRMKDSKLQPLVVAVNGDLPLHAHLMVQRDNPTAALKELQGKTLALPKETMPFCKLYLQRQCQAFSRPPATFFAKIITPATLEDALDDVVEGLATATVVDSLCLDSYRRRKPGRAAKLKEVQRSTTFPSAAIVYKPGNLEEKELAEFRNKLIRAKEDADSRRLLTLWKLTGFEPVPDDYEKLLSAIAKEYPR